MTKVLLERRRMRGREYENRIYLGKIARRISERNGRVAQTTPFGERGEEAMKEFGEAQI